MKLISLKRCRGIETGRLASRDEKERKVESVFLVQCWEARMRANKREEFDK